MKLHAPLLTVAALVLGATPFAQATAPASSAPVATQTHLLSPTAKLLGLPVRNDSEKNLGEIGDLLVDPSSGEIRYAVLEVGGFLGIGEDQRVVPWSYVQITPDEKDVEKCHARTSLTEAQVKAAPKSKRGQRYDSELDRRIEATFGKDDAWAFVGKGQPEFVWLSQLDGIVLKDEQGQDVGKVKEVVLAPQNGCAAYVVVDSTQEAGDKDVVVPWSQIQFAYDRNDLVEAKTALAMTRFAGAPEYDEKDWKRMSSTTWLNEVATYYSTDPFWKTTRFASARKLPAQRP